MNDAGDWAESGKWYTYTIQATPVGSTEPQTKEFKFYLDNTKPTLEDVQLYEEDGNVYLTGVASDDFYIQRIRVIDSTQEYWYLAEAEAFDAITETGAKTRFTFDVTELASDLAADGKNPGRIGLLLEDVAYNSNLTFVDLGPQSMTIESLNLKVGESKQANVSIKPARLADAKLTWASQDESVAEVDANGMVTGVADGETMISATAMSGLTAYARVTVGKGTPVLLTYGEAPELNDRFQTEERTAAWGSEQGELLRGKLSGFEWRCGNSRHGGVQRKDLPRHIHRVSSFLQQPGHHLCGDSRGSNRCGLRRLLHVHEAGEDLPAGYLGKSGYLCL